MARHTYLARLVWNAVEGWWEAPLKAQCTGIIDLRSNPQCGTAVTPQGYGLFTYPSQVTIAGSLYFGLDNFRITAAKRTQLNTMLGVTGTIRDTHLIIKELLVNLADPTGLTRWKPIRVGSDRKLKFAMAGVDLADEIVNDVHPAFENTMAVRRADYRRAKVAGVPLSNLRKWNGFDLRKYGVAIDRLLDVQDRADGSETPATSISDTFPVDQALDTGGVWVEVLPGTWAIVSGEVSVGSESAVNLARHTTALSSDDHKASIIATVQGVNGAPGACARVSTDASGSQDFYLSRLDATENLLFKVVNAVATELASPNVTVSLPDTVEIEPNNSTIITRFNGTQTTSLTDTSITGNLYCGMHLRRTGDRITQFDATDLGGAAGVVPVILSQYRERRS